jgi:hypothetical protein
VDHAILIRYNTQTLPSCVFNNVVDAVIVAFIIKFAVKQMLHGRRKYLFLNV